MRARPPPSRALPASAVELECRSTNETMLYRVTLQRAITEEASIEVEAETPEQAEDAARQREADDMVAWTKCNDDTSVNVEKRT